MPENSQQLCCLPLSSIEPLFAQKCVLPQSFMPADLKPGSWVKCVYDSENDGYALCQIFSRQDLPAAFPSCYLDACVAKSPNSPLGEKKFIKCFELLQPNGKEVKKVHVTFILNSSSYVQQHKKLTRGRLQAMAQHLLAPLQLLPNCSVQTPELREMGVQQIDIRVSAADQDSYFAIDEHTEIVLDNVLLSNAFFTATHVPFYLEACQMVMQQLQNVLQVTNMQRTKSSQQIMRFCLNALIVGATGCGKSSLVAEFVRQQQLNCFCINAANVMGQYPGETEAKLRKTFEAAVSFERQMKSTSPTVIILEDLQLLCPSVKNAQLSSVAADISTAMRVAAQLAALIDELYKDKCEIMCLATSSAMEQINSVLLRPGRFHKEIAIAAPVQEQRLQLVELFLQDALQPKAFAELEQHVFQQVALETRGYVAADMAMLARTVAQIMASKSNSLDINQAIKQALKKSQPASIKGTDVTVFKLDQGFESLGGMSQLKLTLQVSVLAGLKQEKAFKRFGLSLPKGILLYGPPGCAKTSIAKCLAAEAKMTFIATSGAEVYSPYVGCAEKFVAKLFDTARKNAPCLLFLDEIDSLVGRRSLAQTSADVQIRILSTLLTEMDGIVGSSSNSPTAASQHILVVAATNRPDMVDDALMRPGRFDRLIHCVAPDFDSRLAILQMYSQKMPFAANVELLQYAERTANYSGADLCNLCNEAAMQAFNRDFDTNEIEAQDFEQVLKTQKSSLIQSQIDWYYDFEKRFLN